MVDTHAYCTHFIIDRSVNVSLWNGCLFGKACSEHDVLWTGHDTVLTKSVNREIYSYIYILVYIFLQSVKTDVQTAHIKRRGLRLCPS